MCRNYVKKSSMRSLQVKRIYDEPQEQDGVRILVDRLWPRGVTKERAAIKYWLKDVAPSPALRTWFGHDPQRFQSFAMKYTKELAHNDAVDELRNIIATNKTVTLLYAAKDPRINHAVLLKKFLSKK